MSSKLERSISNWAYTWESQSHIPTLRLFLFNPSISPSSQCHNLSLHLSLPLSLLHVTFTPSISLTVPIPRVLLDPETPVSFKALDDHIEVKLALLLPVDHSLVLNFESLLDLGDVRLDDDGKEKNGFMKQLSMDSDVSFLSSKGEVDFYCRSCLYKLTGSPISTFVEMPSINWLEMADNWFGNCCCSFGEVSEKLVAGYAKSYISKMGVCLVSPTNITLCKDDLVGCEFPDSGVCERLDNDSDRIGESGPNESELTPQSNELPKSENKENHLDSSCKCDANEEKDKSEGVPRKCSELDFSMSKFTKELNGVSCDDIESHAQDYDGECCSHLLSESSSKQNSGILQNHKPLLNGYLENIFMVKASNLSRDVEWVEFFCPQCSSVLGAYPCDNGGRFIDSGVRLFKCNISTSLPVGGTGDVFRKYTLEKMFANQLLECAKDQLSYRTVVRNLKLRSPMLQIVLINTNSWSATGHCLDTEGKTESLPKIDLHPVIKVLFSECSGSTEAQLRMLEESVSKDLIEEVFMLTHQIEELIKSLSARRDTLPPSYSSLQGLSLSSLPM